VARDSERRLESLRPTRSQETFPQDGKRPTIADHTDGAGKGAWLPPARPISFPLSGSHDRCDPTDPERSTKVLNKNELSGYGLGMQWVIRILTVRF
jgi:hypothetical protein